MTNLLKQPHNILVFGMMLFACVTSASGSVTMQIVADNDFALFVGTTGSVERLIYQNDASWPQQIADAANFDITLDGNETTFYLLGLGGGGDENISGTVDGVDLTTIPVTMSSDIGPFLTDFEAQAQGTGTVENGTFNATLADVQAALPQLTWGPTVPTDPLADIVSAQSPTGHGFHFDASTAHLFQFPAVDVGVSATPEPSSWLLMMGGGVMIVLSRCRRSSSPRA